MKAQLDKAIDAKQVDLPPVLPAVAQAPDEMPIHVDAAAPATALHAHAVWFRVGIHAGTARANHRKARHAHTHTHTHRNAQAQQAVATAA